jgi:SHS2 domain-containing protein
VGTLALTGGHFHLLEHTADIGLEVTAPSCEALFVTAAQGLKALMFGASPAKGGLSRDVRVEAGDIAELLVVWLNEILVFSETAHAVPASFSIQEVRACSLTATIIAEPFDATRHTVERGAKAVTYHQLVVEERQGGWYARVYIDL